MLSLQHNLISRPQNKIEVSKSSVWKHTTLCDKGVFSFIIISQRRQANTVRDLGVVLDSSGTMNAHTSDVFLEEQPVYVLTARFLNVLTWNMAYHKDR